ncbi:MAG: 30S ribosomal protein S20 [Deltaproteobacteria bacterium]|nr:MAG: 30S ribosomal protein S20 [Deltaproteobacteria bacterium]
MATSSSAQKRHRQNLKRRKRNQNIKSSIKTTIKKVRIAVEEKKREDAQVALKSAIPAINKAASKGVIHPRNASRKISRLTKKVSSLSA